MNQFSHLNKAVSEICPNACGLKILISGQTVFEQYYQGHDDSERFHVASVTKSFLSALVGIALDEGYIPSIDEPISSFFPEYIPREEQTFYKSITLRHLLTMTAPFAFPGPMEPFEEICSSDDWCLATLSFLGHEGPPFSFRYSSFGAHLVSAILKKCTGMNARDFANAKLCSKIGMESIPVSPMRSYDFDSLFGKDVNGWVSDPQDNSAGGWGLTLSLHDMSALGQLYLQNGVWNGEQILPSQWVKDSTEPNSFSYGYFWWVIPDLQLFAAIGDGGNIICCIPEKHAVISMASSFGPNPKDRIAFIKEHILPYL